MSSKEVADVPKKRGRPAGALNKKPKEKNTTEVVIDTTTSTKVIKSKKPLSPPEPLEEVSIKPKKSKPTEDDVLSAALEEIEKVTLFEPKLDPETISQTVLKEIGKRGIFYRAWKPEILKEVGEVTKELIGQPIRVADDPRNKTYILKDIKEVGTIGYKDGALVIDDPAFVAPRSLFLDEASCFPKKRKVSNSQLVLKKKVL